MPTKPNSPSPERATAASNEGKTIPIDGAKSAQSSAPASSSENDGAAQVADPHGSAAGESSESEPVEAVVEPSSDEQVAQAKAEADAWQDKFLRLHAEWDTYRRRTAEQRDMEKARAAEKLVESLLPVIDDFERTIDYATKNGEQGLLDGVKAVRTKFVDTLVKDGVTIIDPAGEAFDALEAQAVATVDDASVPDETVAEVYQKGYKMGTKVLRPAMVTVSCGGPKREKPQDNAE